MTASVAWLSDYMQQARDGRLDAPPSAWWIVTRACNLSCYYCFADARKRDPDELTTEAAKLVLDDFADNGVMFTTFLGGEPLSRRDIYELIDYSTDLGIYTALLTNGLLVDRSTVTHLRDVGCEMVGVSIDSNDPAVHDAVRGVRGSLAGAKGTIRHAVDLGMRCSVRIVVTEDSFEAVPELFRWALDSGVEELILLPMFMVGRAAGSPDDRRRDVVGKQLFLATLDRLRAIGAPLGITVPEQDLACPQGIELNAPSAEHHHAGHAVGFEQSVGCKVGRFMVSVQPNGDIHSCPFVPYRIGRLKEQSIRDIWQAPLLRRAREDDLGCLARSMIHLGRPDAPDPTDGRDLDALLAELTTGVGAGPSAATSADAPGGVVPGGRTALPVLSLDAFSDGAPRAVRGSASRALRD